MLMLIRYGTGYDLASRRKNATRESTATLKAWLNEHKKNPYPTKGEKIMLAIITKMTLTQVSSFKSWILDEKIAAYLGLSLKNLTINIYFLYLTRSEESVSYSKGVFKGVLRASGIWISDPEFRKLLSH